MEERLGHREERSFSPKVGNGANGDVATASSPIFVLNARTNSSMYGSAMPMRGKSLTCRIAAFQIEAVSDRRARSVVADATRFIVAFIPWLESHG
jgi:hypothetical protein